MSSDALDLEMEFLYLTVRWIPDTRSNELTSTSLCEEYISIDAYIRNVFKKLPSFVRVGERPKLLERLKNVKADVKQFHARDLVTEHRRSGWMFKSDMVLGFINGLLEIPKLLLSSEGHVNIRVRIQIKALEQKVRLLRDVTEYTTKRSNNSDEVLDLMIHIRWVTVNALIISYSCLVDEMDEDMALEINGKVSHLLQISKPVNPEVRGCYIKAFESFNPSDTPWDDQILLIRLVDFYLLDLTEKMEHFREDMIYLKTTLIDKPELRFEATQYKYLLRSIDEVICKAVAVIYAQDTEDDTARERNLSFSDLLKSIKFIRPYVLSLESHHDINRTIDLEQSFLIVTFNWVPSNNHICADTFWSIQAYIGDVYNNMSKDAQVVEAPKILERLDNIKEDVKQIQRHHLNSEALTNFVNDKSSWISKNEAVSRFIDDLLKSLYRLLRFEGHVSTPIGKKIEDLEKMLRLLRDVIEYTTKRSNKSYDLDDLMHYIRGVAVFVLCISYLCVCQVKYMNEYKISDLLYLMKPINPDIAPIYIRAFKSLHPSDSPWDDKHLLVSLVDFFLLHQTELMETLRKDMIFLKDILVEQAQICLDPTQDKHDLLRSIDEVICKAGPIIYSKEDTDTAEARNVALVNLLESINITRKKFMKILVGNIPSTDQLHSFDFFLENLEELLNRKTDMRHHFENVRIDLLYLRSFLDKIKDQCDEDLKNVRGRVIFLAHTAEYIADSIAFEPCQYLSSQLLNVAEDIKLVKAQVIEIHEKKAPNNSNISAVSRVFSQDRSRPDIDELVVGFQDESQAITEWLNGLSKSREIFSIVGMPGLGKTTLARKVYNHSSVQSHFDVRAWVCVSQTYRLKDLLLDILGDIIELRDGINEKSEYELADLLHKNLLGKRYLLVLDDLWDTGAWDDLKTSFPNQKTQSRILITSQMHDAARKLTPTDNIHFLRLFRDDESWMLLKAKLFQGENCPEELFKVGKEIAENCKGLPLSVALAAGILSGMEKKESEWKRFAETLTSQIVRHEDNQCMDMIELSYRHLPGHLKSCFLYLGAFPEDQEILVRKLTWLWISEGFVKNTEAERLEDVALGYLTDLIGRNLVMHSKGTSRAGVKACRLHDLLRDFCLEKAAEEDFMHRVSGLAHLLPDTETSDNAHSLINYSRYRLSISSKREHFIRAKPFSPNARTLLLFHEGDNHPDHPYDASFISRNFKIIRVLDLGHINIKDPFNGIELLIHLRYLSLVGDIDFIPSSIANLWRLEVLLYKGVRVEAVSVPDTIWNMVNLRHLHVNDGASFDINNHNSNSSQDLDNLESFSTPSLVHRDELHDLLKRMPKLRKLKFLLLCNSDCNVFLMLIFLSQLESLKASGDYNSFRSASKSHFEFHFPSNLRKLTLSGFCIRWSEMSCIGSLPNLEVLKLLRGAFKGKVWSMEEEFLKLKYLKLEALDIEDWDATNDIDHVPILEKLVLRKCRKLFEIPQCFADISTLEMIEMQWCRPSAVESAMDILKDKRENGNEDFKVLLHNKDKPKQKGSASYC